MAATRPPPDHVNARLGALGMDVKIAVFPLSAEGTHGRAQ